MTPAEVSTLLARIYADPIEDPPLTTDDTGDRDDIGSSSDTFVEPPDAPVVLSGDSSPYDIEREPEDETPLFTLTAGDDPYPFW